MLHIAGKIFGKKITNVAAGPVSSVSTHVLALFS